MVLIFCMLQCENVVLNNFLLKTQFNIVLLLALLDLVLHPRQLLTLLSVELAQLVKLIFCLCQLRLHHFHQLELLLLL